MGRFYLKSGLFVLLAAFCILLGVNLAGDGVEQIHGPIIDKPTAEEQALREQPPNDAEQSRFDAKRAKEKEAEKVRAAYEELKRNRADEKSLFGSIGSAIGGMLTSIAGFIISIFSSLFDALI
jgi:hypothetical protein